MSIWSWVSGLAGSTTLTQLHPETGGAVAMQRYNIVRVFAANSIEDDVPVRGCMIFKIIVSRMDCVVVLFRQTVDRCYVLESE